MKQKIAASKACVRAGAGMVKTSTGFVKDGKGATVEDIKLIKEAIEGSTLGIKAFRRYPRFRKSQSVD